MNRWKVESVDYGTYRRWVVSKRNRSAPFFASFGKWSRRADFKTYAEAIAYADRLARTVEIELPPSAHTSTQTMTTRPVLDGLTVTFATPGGGHGIHITRDELKPLALALLAHHYKQEQA